MSQLTGAQHVPAGEGHEAAKQRAKEEKLAKVKSDRHVRAAHEV
jgi:hypothetical protein